MEDHLVSTTTLITAVIDHLVLCYGEDEKWMVEALQQATWHIQDVRTEGE